MLLLQSLFPMELWELRKFRFESISSGIWIGLTFAYTGQIDFWTQLIAKSYLPLANKLTHTNRYRRQFDRYSYYTNKSSPATLRDKWAPTSNTGSSMENVCCLLQVMPNENTYSSEHAGVSEIIHKSMMFTMLVNIFRIKYMTKTNINVNDMIQHHEKNHRFMLENALCNEFRLVKLPVKRQFYSCWCVKGFLRSVQFYLRVLYLCELSIHFKAFSAHSRRSV